MVPVAPFQEDKYLDMSLIEDGLNNSLDNGSTGGNLTSLSHPDLGYNYQDIPDLAKSHPLYKAAMSFNLYYSPVLIVTGFLGNSLSLVVMLQRNNRKFSCCVYLAGLAIGDNLFMCNALHLWLMTAVFPEHFSDKHCTILAFSFQVRMSAPLSQVTAKRPNECPQLWSITAPACLLGLSESLLIRSWLTDEGDSNFLPTGPSKNIDRISVFR